jgi:hypothetical protein
MEKLEVRQTNSCECRFVIGDLRSGIERYLASPQTSPQTLKARMLTKSRLLTRNLPRGFFTE